MRTAIQKAVYYLDTDLVNVPVIELSYTNRQEFKNIVSKLHENIEVIATFGQKDNFCYEVFNVLPDLYNELLLEKTTSVYIVNRKDIAIKLTRIDNNEKSRVAVIKIDAVLSEYTPSSYASYLIYPTIFALGYFAKWVSTKL